MDLNMKEWIINWTSLKVNGFVIMALWGLDSERKLDQETVNRVDENNNAKEQSPRQP